MANVWVYHGQSFRLTMNSGKQVLIRDGQYIMATNEDFGSYTIFDFMVHNPSTGWQSKRFNFNTSTNSSTVQLPFKSLNLSVPKGGAFRKLSKANSLKYGAVNNHAASGGNYYTLRKNVACVDKNGKTKEWLNAGDRVVIGRAHGFFNPARNAIRIWGYKKKGKAAKETFGYYVREVPTASNPTSYTLNTI